MINTFADDAYKRNKENISNILLPLLQSRILSFTDPNTVIILSLISYIGHESPLKLERLQRLLKALREIITEEIQSLPEDFEKSLDEIDRYIIEYIRSHSTS